MPAELEMLASTLIMESPPALPSLHDDEAFASAQVARIAATTVAVTDVRIVINSR